MVQINGPAISVWISWIVIILTSQDTWSHVSLCTVEIWYILERCTKWSPGTLVMYSNRLRWPTPGCIYSWFIFEGRSTFKWDIKWHRRLKHCWLCGITGTITAGELSLFFLSLFSLISALWTKPDNILNCICFLANEEQFIAALHYLCTGFMSKSACLLLLGCTWFAGDGKREKKAVFKSTRKRLQGIFFKVLPC